MNVTIAWLSKSGFRDSLAIEESGRTRGKLFLNSPSAGV
jgi:hypothetical protein